VVSVTPWPRFTPRKKIPGKHWIGGRVDPRAGKDDKGMMKWNGCGRKRSWTNLRY